MFIKIFEFSLFFGNYINIPSDLLEPQTSLDISPTLFLFQPDISYSV
jgi:hypothetical protein